MFEALSSLCSAFGLSSAAGLNAYIPLLIVSVMQNQGKIHLAKNFEFMGQWWFIAILVVLLIIELVVDKIPGADHVNDIVHTVVRPAAGAIIFAAEAGTITSIHPGIWAAIGLLTSGGVHATKALARPVVNLSSAGVGAPIVSVIENLVSTVLAIVAILVPILAVILMAIFGWMLYKLFRKFFGSGTAETQAIRSFPIEPTPTVVMAVPVNAPDEPAQKNWGGGV